MRVTKKELAVIIENYLHEQDDEASKPVEDKPADSFDFSVLIDKMKFKISTRRKDEKLLVKVINKMTGDEVSVSPGEVGALFYAALKNMKETDENYKNILFAMQNDILDDPGIKDYDDKKFVKWLQGRSRHFLIWLGKFKERFKNKQ